MPRYILTVLSNAVSKEREHDFNEWYDNVHLSDLLNVPGFVSARRFRVTSAQPPPPYDPNPAHRFLAIYEVVTDDLEGTFELMVKAGSAMSWSDAFDLTSAQGVAYELISSRTAEA